MITFKAPVTDIDIYLAGPLFNESQRMWLRKTKEMIEEAFDGWVTVWWPYEFFTAEELTALGPQAKYHIFETCRSRLAKSDLLVALLDGSEVDDGTAWEIGYFYSVSDGAHDIIGIRTDFRNGGDTATSRVNAMIECSCQEIVSTREQLLLNIQRWIKQPR